MQEKIKPQDFVFSVKLLFAKRFSWKRDWCQCLLHSELSYCKYDEGDIYVHETGSLGPDVALCFCGRRSITLDSISQLEC